jgi:hypothetical protein
MGRLAIATRLYCRRADNRAYRSEGAALAAFLREAIAARSLPAVAASVANQERPGED